ncbi:MAG: PspA/IM30 family protein [Rhodospirillales bacterium]|nr:PspA/IM30 family protein [Rhodospirillales bacterium]
MASIFKRISDVVTANINDLVDRVEDPERMVKQLIREMEENIQQAKEGVVDAIASEKRLEKELELNRGQCEDWGKKAEQALRNGNEALARNALVRKNEHEEVYRALEPSWQASRNTSERLKAQLRALEAKLEEARRKRSTLVARQRAAEARQQIDKTLSAFDAGIAAQANFTRMEDKVAEMEARTAALDELGDDASQLEREFLDMRISAAVEDELTELRKKVQTS